MRIANYQKREILEIEWEDTTTISGWRSDGFLQKAVPSPCRTVGYFRKQDKNSITITKSIADDDDDGLDGQTIPRGCIKKIIRLKH